MRWRYVLAAAFGLLARAEAAEFHCTSVGARNEISTLDLAAEGVSIDINRETASAPEGARPPYFKIESLSRGKGSARIRGVRIEEGVGCAGGCGNTRFEL